MKNKKEELDNKGLNEVIGLSKKILKIFYVVLIAGAILALITIFKVSGLFKLLMGVLKVVSPLFIGFVIAWLFNPLVKKLKDRGLPKVLSALIVYAIFLLFLFLFIRVFIPVIYTQLNELLNRLPSVINDMANFSENFMNQFSIDGIDIASVKNNVFEVLKNYILDFTNSLPETIINIVVSLFSGIGTILISLVVGLYMLFDFDSISKHFIKLLPVKHQYEISCLITNIGTEVRKCVNGTLLIASMVLVCDTVGFTIVGLDAPLLFGVFCGLTDLIPYIGPYIGGAAAVVVGFSQSPIIGISVLIICIIVQLVENYILQPVVMSKAMQLHPVTIIVGLLIFGYFFGIVGMIVATPCIALLKVIWKFIINKFELFKDESAVIIKK